MSFMQKPGARVVLAVTGFTVALAASFAGLAAGNRPGALGDQSRTGTLGPNEIGRSKGGNTPPLPKGDTTPTSPPQPQTPKKEEPKEKPPEEDQQNSNQQSQSPGKSDADIFESKSVGDYYYGVGNCKCEGMTDLKDNAVKETIDYYKANQPCITGGATTQYMAVNDYRKSTGCMYIIDHEGNCKKAVDAAYGIGSSSRGDAPTPNCGGGSLGTPSGFHVTAPHTGGNGRYDTSNSLLMKDLQGQGSAGRGILIHAGSCSGGACSWGCTGVSSNGQSSEETFKDVQGLLPPGSLVYNYFGDKSCREITNKNECRSGGFRGTGGTSQGSNTKNTR